MQTQRTQHARSTNRHESTQARAHTDETRTRRKGGRKEEGKVKVVAVARQVGGCGNGVDGSGEGEGGTTVVVGSKGGGAPGRLGSLTYCRHDQLSVGNSQGGGGIMP